MSLQIARIATSADMPDIAHNYLDHFAILRAPVFIWLLPIQNSVKLVHSRENKSPVIGLFIRDFYTEPLGGVTQQIRATRIRMSCSCMLEHKFTHLLAPFAGKKVPV